LQNALKELNKQASTYQEASENFDGNPQKAKALNALLKDMERFLTREHGLPRRPWFKHHVYAPGFYTGYGVKTLPGVREAIEQGNFEEVNEQIEILEEVLLLFSANIEKAVSIME
jgi:N-acetylated-alpha-linked acidic dipeptidase